MHHTVTGIADVFNVEYQCAHADADAAMRSIAQSIAFVLYPDSAELRASFLAAASMSGLDAATS